MKRLVLVLVLALALAPASALAEEAGEESTASVAPAVTEGREKPRSCKVIAKQIAHFQDVAQMAEDRGDELWLQGTEAHIENLRLQQARKCPQDVPPSMRARLAKALVDAARIAAALSTFGAF